MTVNEILALRGGATNDSLGRAVLIRLTPNKPVASMRDMNQTVYRKCTCGETAHDLKYQANLRRFVWACRNCSALALNRKGLVKQQPGRAHVEHDRGVGGDDPQTDKGG
jgi:hypothetical protein